MLVAKQVLLTTTHIKALLRAQVADDRLNVPLPRDELRVRSSQ